MFRYKKSVGGDYAWQGYVYFASLRYRSLPEKKRGKIDRLCKEVGGEYEKALLEFVTTDTTATAICIKYPLSRATLYRVVSEYYKNFPKSI